MSNPKFAQKHRRILIVDDDEEEDYSVGYKKYCKTDEEDWDLRPLGKPIAVSGHKTSFYQLVYDGVQFQLDDTVLLDPEHKGEKPYVAIIKEISKTYEEPLKLKVQWLYRPEEAVKRGGGTYKPLGRRELFLSFHTDEVHAESIMHACVVHFVPLTKQIPDHKKHPGFVVQYVYDFEEFKVYNMADGDYKDAEQREIDHLLKKTIEELGDLPDVVEPKPVKNEHLDKENSVLPVEFSTVDNGLHKHESFSLETSERTSAVGSDYYSVLSSYKLLTKTRVRNTCLEMLLESVQSICTGMSHNQSGKEEENEGPKWPREAVFAVAALEEAAHSALSANSAKYKHKMRQLVFNLKKNDVLAQRLLKKELEPGQILKMSPEELKTGLMAEEMSTKEPEDVPYVQMTEASCTNCSEKRVALMNIFQVGSRNSYQIQCQACGTSRQEWMMPQ